MHHLRFPNLLSVAAYGSSKHGMISFFEVCNLASNVNSACDNCEDMELFVRDARLVLKKIRECRAPLIFRKLPPDEGNRRPQLIAFCDAGYASLRDSASVESCVVIYVVPIKRHGVITCAGNAVSLYTRKISRICRPSTHAEGVALANAADLTLYTQCILSEILYQQHDFTFLQQSTGIPLMSQFKKAPDACDIKQERTVKCNASHHRASVLFFDSCQVLSEVQAPCMKCSQTAGVSLEQCTYFIIEYWALRAQTLLGLQRMLLFFRIVPTL